MNVSAGNFRYVCDLVHRRAAIVIENGKEYLVDARLTPIAKEYGLPTVDALVEKLRSDDASGVLTARIIDAMTTNETSFFRDVHPFETLRNVVLPKLIRARESTKTLRIWCAAASTGQEPYSIAMTIAEHFPQLATWNVQLLATDINVSVLQQAKQGIYRQIDVNRGLPATMLVKYFDRQGADWRIKASIRDRVSFQQLNLLDRWPLFTEQDVVFIRNVLIYFDQPTKTKILGRIRDLLKPDGVLFLGGAENVMASNDLFVSERINGTLSTIYRAA